MEMKIANGDYVKDIWGGFETVSGDEETLARILYKLQCRRGGFTPFPQLGSRMYMLFREKRTDRSAAAARYAAEALMDEPGAYVTGAEVTELDGELLSVHVHVNIEGTEAELTSVISQEVA